MDTPYTDASFPAARPAQPQGQRNAAEALTRAQRLARQAAEVTPRRGELYPSGR